MACYQRQDTKPGFAIVVCDHTEGPSVPAPLADVRESRERAVDLPIDLLDTLIRAAYVEPRRIDRAAAAAACTGHRDQ